MVFLVTFFSSLLYCKNTAYNTQTYKVCINRLFILSVRLPASTGLLEVRFGGSEKLYMDF